MEDLFELTPKEVWDTLKTIDVNEHTQVRNGLTYLSWAWAWKVMKDIYPDFTVEWHDTVFYNDTAEVGCIVRIGPHVMAEEFLPVMNPGKGERGAKYEARQNPTSRDINDAKKRCLVKCFALLGLGLYIYAGEDLPEDHDQDSDAVIVQVLSNEVKRMGRDLGRKGYEFSDTLQKQLRSALEDKEREKLEHARNTLQAIIAKDPVNN